MQTRHNTASLQKAIEHVVRQASIPTLEAEAAALEKRARAQGFRRLATGSAIAVAAIGIGLGIYLGFLPHRPTEVEVPARQSTEPNAAQKLDEASGKRPAETKTADRIPEDVSIPTPPPPNPTSPSSIPTSPSSIPDPQLDRVTTNFTKFTEKTVELLGQRWQINAGHYFDTERDAQWRYAWCYTERVIDGVKVKLELVERDSPEAKPRAPIATAETLDRAGLDASIALALASQCAWLDDKRFLPKDFATPAELDNPFVEKAGEVQLIGRNLKYDGPIDSFFLETIQKYEFETLELNSHGGLISEALVAGSWLRQTQRNVEIKKTCLSACVLVLAGGIVRSASPQAQIGVHRFYAIEEMDAKTAMESAQETSSEILKFFQAMGVSAELFHAMAAVPSNTISLIDHQKLREWGLIGGKEGVAIEPIPPISTEERDVAIVFEHRDGFDALGGDLDGMPIRGASVDSCRRSCDDRADCEAFTFNKTFSVCFLKGKTSVLVRDPTAYTGLRTEVAPRVRISDLVFNSRTALTGRSLMVTQDPYVDCVLRCDAIWKCAGFNFSRSKKTCTLLEQINGAKYDADFASGKRQ